MVLRERWPWSSWQLWALLAREATLRPRTLGAGQARQAKAGLPAPAQSAPAAAQAPAERQAVVSAETAKVAAVWPGAGGWRRAVHQRRAPGGAAIRARADRRPVARRAGVRAGRRAVVPQAAAGRRPLALQAPAGRRPVVRRRKVGRRPVGPQVVAGRLVGLPDAAG
jgi:hypothetical protein